MSIRLLFLWLYVLYFSYYAWAKSWYIAACAVIFLMAFAFHPDIPRSMWGITGFSCINILLFNVTAAWWFSRRRLGIHWDAPRVLNICLILYFLVVAISTFRFLVKLDVYYASMMPTEEGIIREGWMSFFNEQVLDSVRYILPAIFIYEGCRSRRSAVLALACILAMYFMVSIQVIKYMPWSALTMSGEELSKVSFKILKNSLGYSRVTVSMILAGASWAMLCAVPLVQRNSYKLALIWSAGAIAFGQALTGGRMGYLTFGIVGLALGIIKWRRLLLALLLAAIALPILVPSARDRLLKGFSGGSGNGPIDQQELSAGRSEAWPAVIDSVRGNFLFGFGREGMITSGTHYWLSMNIFGSPDFAHPHQAYLQLLLDTGIVGFALAMPIFFVLLSRSYSVLRDNSDPLYSAVGGTAFSLLLALMVAGMSGQTFYPEHQAVGLWASSALMMRLWVERHRAQTLGWSYLDRPTEGEVADSPLGFEGVNDPIHLRERRLES